MGGKNPLIVDSDADLDQAVPAAAYSAFGFAGQKCSAASRLIVLDATSALVLGPAGVLVGLSVLLGGAGIWGEYLRVAAVMSGADLVDPRNAGLAAQLVIFMGGDNGLVRLVHVPVALAAVAVTGWAALARRDPLESLAWAAAASLLILPVTWYHYPAALLPFGIGAMLRSYGTPAAPRVAGLLAGACALSAVGLVWPPLLWAAACFVVAAAWRSGRDL